MKLLARFAQVGFIGVCLAMVLTFWAIAKSRERTECYRHAQAVEQCAGPNWLERQIRALLT